MHYSLPQRQRPWNLHPFFQNSVKNQHSKVVKGIKCFFFLLGAGWTNLTSDNCSPIRVFCKHSADKILKVGIVDWGHLNENCEKGVRCIYQIHFYNDILLSFKNITKVYKYNNIQDHLISNVESQLLQNAFLATIIFSAPQTTPK